MVVTHATLTHAAKWHAVLGRMKQRIIHTHAARHDAVDVQILQRAVVGERIDRQRPVARGLVVERAVRLQVGDPPARGPGVRPQLAELLEELGAQRGRTGAEGAAVGAVDDDHRDARVGVRRPVDGRVVGVDDVHLGHEATVSRVSEEQLFYLQSRGMPEDEAMAMIVRGFIEPIARELPMEYALELNKLIEMNMEGSVG